MGSGEIGFVRWPQNKHPKMSDLTVDFHNVVKNIWEGIIVLAWLVSKTHPFICPPKTVSIVIISSWIAV